MPSSKRQAAQGGNRKKQRGGRSSRRAVFLSSALMAFLGAAVGAIGVYIGGQGARLSAARPTTAQASLLHERPVLRTQSGEALLQAYQTRLRRIAAIVNKFDAQSPVMASGQEERLSPSFTFLGGAEGPEKPKIIIIVDDMGPDRRAFERLVALPGPLTLSFLPYASGVQAMVDHTRAIGWAAMLHLPMEPVGAADPGPDYLSPTMSPASMRRTLRRNLQKFDGYIGVNNHMGSAFTADQRAMQTVLAALQDEGLFFLDSLTTARSKTAAAAAHMTTPIFTRDVFLDPDLDRETVFSQLKLVEEIALETGYAVAICHPRAATIDVLGPWLTTALARGFELATVEALASDAGHRRNTGDQHTGDQQKRMAPEAALLRREDRRNTSSLRKSD